MFAKIQSAKRASVWALGVALLVVTLGVTRAHAQGGTATISGSVTDTSGGAIAGAKVDVRNTGTGIVQSTTTDAQGHYTAPDLPIGVYDVEASSSGFSTVVRSGINLTVGARPVIDLSLSVGQTQQTVTVEGQVSQVETQSSSISNLIEPTQMRDLPLNGRNFEQLLTLSPGVVQQMGGATFYGTQSNYSVAGSRPEGQAFLLDDTDVQDFWKHGTGSGSTGTSLGVDAIAEFQTLVNTYSAQDGGNGAVVNAVTKSGTNDFHGSGYEFLRNNVLDARNYFDPSKIPPFRRNQFGGTLGGPIKKDKAFFFVNYEGLRQLFGQSATADVPDQNAHNGLLPTGPGGALVNVGVSPAVAPTLALFPLPTTSGPTQLLNATEVTKNGLPTGILVGSEVASQVAAENYGIARFDYTFSPKDSLFVRYGVDRANIVNPFQNPVTPSINIPLWPETDTTNNQYVTFEEKRIVSPNVINLARFSFVRTIEGQTVTGDTAPLEFFPPSQRENGEIAFPGSLSTIGANVLDPSVELQNKFIVQDDVIWSHGAHSFTFGMGIERVQDNTSGPFEEGGVWTFGSLQNFLTDKATQIVGALPGQANATGNLRELAFTPYFQDLWRVSTRLTLNLGLRWEPTVNPTEWHHVMETVVTPPLGTGGVINTSSNPSGTSPFNFQVVPHAFAQNPSTMNFDPRIGFAYDPFDDHKTSIRGGFGIFHDIVEARTILPGYWLNPPFTLGVQLNPAYPCAFCGGGSPSVSTQQQGLDYQMSSTPYEMQWNLNVQREVAANTVVTVGYVGSRGVHLILSRDVNPETLSPGSTPANPVFAHLAKGSNGLVTIVPNAPLCGCSNLSFMFEKLPTAMSNYNSLQASLNHQFSHDFQLQAVYTYSKSLDDGSLTYGLEGTNAAAQNLENPYNNGSIDYGRSTFDRTNNFRVSGLYSFPFKANKLVAGWQVSGILSAVSGPPFTIFDGFNDAGEQGWVGALSGERPNLVPGCSPNPILGQVSNSVGFVGRWYNPSCFAPQAVGTLGNLGRDTLVGPGFTNFDFALLKTTSIPKISESFAVQFRAEFFDLFNHPNFNLPNQNVFSQTSTPATTVANFLTQSVAPSPLAGQIVATAGNEVIGGAQRVIQFGLKILF